MTTKIQDYVASKGCKVVYLWNAGKDDPKYEVVMPLGKVCDGAHVLCCFTAADIRERLESGIYDCPELGNCDVCDCTCWPGEDCEICLNKGIVGG